jgi:hypothetical protein
MPMRRRIIWKYGDSYPLFGHLVTAVEGDGELRIVVGFPVSSAMVAFSRSYNRWLKETYAYDYNYGYEKYAFAPEVYVTSTDDEGFTVAYRNIPDSLEINYEVK